MKTRIGLEEARTLTFENIPRLEPEVLNLDHLIGRVLAEEVTARVDSPSVTASLKDGYAVMSDDLLSASREHPVQLRLIGRTTAGGECQVELEPGCAIRITTGAALPSGTQGVLAEEFCHEESNTLTCFANAEPGRNIIERGTDIRIGDKVAGAFEVLNPGKVGLLASAGVSSAAVIRRPRVAVIATGDEVIAPGKDLAPGKLYASNLVEVSAWLGALGMEHTTDVIADEAELLGQTVEDRLTWADAIVTSGGAWTGEKDLIIRVLQQLNWQGFFHRVRLGPGKGVAFGLLQGKAVFCLPGGPAYWPCRGGPRPCFRCARPGSARPFAASPTGPSSSMPVSKRARGCPGSARPD
jgi:molybdopterin molybdotransferase